MSPWKRALLGAAIGALLVLIAHPASRPFYLALLTQGGPSRFFAETPLRLQPSPALEKPRTLADAAYWMLVAAEADQRRTRLLDKDWKNLLNLARRCAVEDPENAFWKQMEAVFAWRLGDRKGSLEAWRRASRANRWDDLQNRRLERIVEGLSTETGTRLGWHYAASYAQRSQAPARMILRQARLVRDATRRDEAEGLELRYATLLNGDLLRSGAKSSQTGLVGVDIVEIACYPTNLKVETSQKRLLLARQALVNRLLALGKRDEANRTVKAFGNNDAWIALVEPENASTEAKLWKLVTLATVSIPSGAIWIAAMGLGLALFGRAVERTPALQHVFRTPVAPAAGVILALLLYWSTGLVLPAIWAALCLAFFAFQPMHERSQDPRELGPLFRFTILVLGVAFFALMTVYLAGRTTAGTILFDRLGVPAEIGPGSPVLLGLAGIVLGLVLLTAPAWGVAQHFAPARLAGFALREFGTGLFVAGILVAVVAGPLAVFVDREARTNLAAISQNEPLHAQIHR
ncbi:MAG TPA: hypothetical protein PLH94_03550 [Fimbriimonadaceae bacterium]|nr:hypothetical protein [Fimbriimonadaceae bacterium]